MKTKYSVEMLETWRIGRLEPSYMDSYTQAKFSQENVHNLDVVTEVLKKRNVNERALVRKHLERLVETAQRFDSTDLARSAQGMLDYYDYAVM